MKYRVVKEGWWWFVQESEDGISWLAVGISGTFSNMKVHPISANQFASLYGTLFKYKAVRKMKNLVKRGGYDRVIMAEII